MKNLALLNLAFVLATPSLANHWNFECPAGGGRKVNIRINNKKAKIVAPFANGIFIIENASRDTKVYKGTTSEGQATLLAPNTNFQLNQIPLGETAEFTYEVAGPQEALILNCRTVPTLRQDPDLN